MHNAQLLYNKVFTIKNMVYFNVKEKSFDCVKVLNFSTISVSLSIK